MAGRNYLPQFMDRSKNYSSNARKPPGGDTNDIFGLEERQRERKMAIYEDKRMDNITASDNKFPKKCLETEDIQSPLCTSGRKLRRSLSESDGPTFRTPPLATGKENIGSHFCLSPESKTRSEGKKLDESEDEIIDEISALKQQELRNQTAGDGMHNIDTRSKLEYYANINKGENTEPDQQKKPRRPCIRVRQPPGGKSSIVF